MKIEISEEVQRYIDSAVKKAVRKYAKENTSTQMPDYVFGLKGLCVLLNISRFKAQALKDSGKIPFQQAGPKKLMFPVKEVLESLNIKN